MWSLHLIRLPGTPTQAGSIKVPTLIWFWLQAHNAAETEQKLDPLLYRNIREQMKDFLGISLEEFAESGQTYGYKLQPMTRIHLHSQLDGELEANGNITYVYLFSIIAVFILLIACINYMNLSTARSSSRAKEVGIRKVLGSKPRRFDQTVFRGIGFIQSSGDDSCCIFLSK
jgi:ABC-type antimicrobial peptide transport system permease subunit